MIAVEVFNTPTSGRKALVVFSGGQDSTTCLLWALKKFDEVQAISFHYGQRHDDEVAIAADICAHLKVKQTVVDLSDQFRQINESALMSSKDDVDAVTSRGLPASFVPNRNLIFLVYAHTFAQKIGFDTLVTGVCQTDYSGYPDCRDEFIQMAIKTMNMASECSISVETPIMWLNKAETFLLADLCGGVDLVIEKTLTCYNGVKTMNDFGMGCRSCNACRLREKGYHEYLSLKQPI
jgi:queuosine biosynthesis protein QueC